MGFVGAVGRDAFGDCLLDRLMMDGIDCSAVRRVADRTTGVAFVAYASDGSRSYVFHLSQSAAACVDVEQLAAGYLGGTKHLHVTGSSLSVSE